MVDVRTWPVRRLKFLATVNDEALTEDTDPDYEIRYIDIGNVDSLGQIHDIAEYRFEAAPSRARRRVRNGDVIISTVRTYLEAIAPISDPPENLVVSTGFAVIRPDLEKLDPKFCKYALRERTFMHEVVARSTGISYPAINASELAGIALPVPPLDMQRKIAAFLDTEVDGLDLLIAEKQRLLLLLTEKRCAAIADFVTHGLNKDTPLRDSGIPWLGNTPAHWQIERAKWLFNERDDRSDSGDEELLTVSHLTGVTSRAEKDVNMFMAESLEGYKRCEAGDLVINTLWAWMGAMGVARQPGIISPAYNVYQPLAQLDPEYVDLLVRTPRFVEEITRYSKGVWSSRLRLYPEGLYEAWLPVPPLDEQQAIVKHVQIETKKLDTLAEATERTIGLLQERRSVLISAAVMGQIKISTPMEAPCESTN